MKIEKYIEPNTSRTVYTCPICGALASVSWDTKSIFKNNNQHHSIQSSERYGDKLGISTCAACGNYHVWINDKMIYPNVTTAEKPCEDMPDDVKAIYNEARNIAKESPRAATALLRLALQLLCKDLGEEGKNIDNDIKSLVSKGLRPNIQKALDTIRVIGNNAVHPGTIDLDDKPEIATALFSLMNIIVDQMITQPKEIDSLYELLPPGQLDHIEKRDNT